MQAQEADNVYIHHHFTCSFTCMTGARLMPTIVSEMQAHDLFHVKDRAET